MGKGGRGRWYMRTALYRKVGHGPIFILTGCFILGSGIFYLLVPSKQDRTPMGWGLLAGGLGGIVFGIIFSVIWKIKCSPRLEAEFEARPTPGCCSMQQQVQVPPPSTMTIDNANYPRQSYPPQNPNQQGTYGVQPAEYTAYSSMTETTPYAGAVPPPQTAPPSYDSLGPPSAPPSVGNTNYAFTYNK